MIKITRLDAHDAPHTAWLNPDHAIYVEDGGPVDTEVPGDDGTTRQTTRIHLPERISIRVLGRASSIAGKIARSRR